MTEFGIVYVGADHRSAHKQTLEAVDVDQAVEAAIAVCRDEEFVACVYQRDAGVHVRWQWQQQEEFSLLIELGNDAMRSSDDIADALEKVAGKLRGGADEGPIIDLNGNTVGSFQH